MSPVADNSLQMQSIQAQQQMSRIPESTAHSVKTSSRRDTFVLPEDIVTLSAERSSNLASSVNKKPSLPVTPTEMKALRDSFSVYA